MEKDYAVLFDLDGTLLYTDELILESFKYVFEKYKPGYNLTREELLSFLGPSLKSSFERYFDKDLVEELIDYYREFNHAKHQEFVYVYPTVIDTLDWLQNNGYPLAIVTTKSKVAAMVGLDTFNLKKYFTSIICLDEVTNTKPDPEGILLAMEKLQVKRGVMIGDNNVDILAGKNANIETIGVSWSPKGTKHLEQLQPNLMIDEMKEIIPFIERNT